MCRQNIFYHAISLLLSLLLLPGLTATVRAQESGSKVNPDILLLEQGKPIERELKGGESHSYKITVSSGQFLHVVVDQRGVDLVLALFGPDGKQLAEVDSREGIQGHKPIFWVSESSQNYRLEIHSWGKEAAAGRYEVRIEELRQATPQDNGRVIAQRAFAEGKQLKEQQKKEFLQKAIEKYTEALPLWHAAGDRDREARTLDNIGEIYFYLGERQKALEYLSQALQLWRALGNRSGEDSALNDIGAVYITIGEMQKGLECLNQALALRRAMGNRSGEATTLNNIAGVYRFSGEKQKALECLNQALQIWRILGSHSDEAQVLNNMGVVYQSLSEFQKSLDYYGQALPVLRALGNHREEANTLQNIGVVYGLLGEYQKALDYYGQALPIWQNTGARYGEALTLRNFGFVYEALGDHQKALDYINQALTLFRAVGERGWEAKTLDDLAMVYQDLNDYQKSLDYYGQALSLHRAVGNTQWEATTLLNIGRVNYSFGEKVKALDYYNQALPLSRAVGDRMCEAATLYGIASVERDCGNLVEARVDIENALKIIETVRAKVASQELRASYFAIVQDYYELCVDLLMRLHKLNPTAGYDAIALQTSERARARSLLELLTEARADIRQGVDPQLLERERSLQQRLSAKAERLTQILSRKHTEEQKVAVEKEIDTLTTEYQQVQAEIREKSPSYAALTQPQPLNLKEIQEQVLDGDTLLLEYALGSESSYLWAVTPTSIASYELPKREEIEAVARRVYALYSAGNQRLIDEAAKRRGAHTATSKAQHENLQYSDAAVELSKIILGPVAEQLGRKRLLVVSDGVLQFVPFAALPLPQETRARTPLIVEHEIVSLPSTSTLAVLRRELAGRRQAPKTVAVLADPVMEKDDERVKSLLGKTVEVKAAERSSETIADLFSVRALTYIAQRSADTDAETSDRLHLPRLIFSRQEAERILGFARPEESKKALDFEASRATALSPELRQYRIVHFATHGLFNSERPELSGLMLSMVDEQGAPQNGFLPAYEIFNMNLPAELVVLSSCQTGLGKQIKGEGLVGLTRGFMYAGAARVVVSLWNVSDKATAELMARFYRKMLAERLRPAAALRAAQISMWQERQWRSPFYWAAFHLQGEWR